MKFKRDETAIKQEIDNGSKIQCVKDCRFYMGKNICSVLTDNEGGVQNKCTFHLPLNNENNND